MNKMNETEKNRIEVAETDLEQVTGGGSFWEFMKKGSQILKNRWAEDDADATESSENGKVTLK